MSDQSDMSKSKKPKRSSLQPVVRARRYSISEARILQINNDISEDMCNATRSELLEVVKYLGDKWESSQRNRQIERSQIALDLLDLVHPILNPTVKRPNAEMKHGEKGK